MLVKCAGCGAEILAEPDPESPVVDGKPMLAELPPGWEYLHGTPPLPVCSSACATLILRRKQTL